MRFIRLLATAAWLGFSLAWLSLPGITLAGVSSLQAAQADEPQTVWRLRTGDKFVVNVFIIKQTEVTIEGQPPETNETRDRFEIEYTVTAVMKSGDGFFTVRLKKATRETGNTTSESIKASAPSARSLEDLRLRFQVDRLGQITNIDRRDKEAFLVALSSLDPSAWQMMRDACSDEALAGWFSRPFWPAVPDPIVAAADQGEATESKAEIPERVEAMALGPFGLLNTTVQLTPPTNVDDETGLKISGTARFAPLVVPKSRQAQARLPLRDITAELDEFSGRVRLAKRNPVGREQKIIQRGLAFQSMETTARFHGSGLLTSVDDEPRKLSFRQTQIQLWILAGQTLARPEMPFGVPAPLDAP